MTDREQREAIAWHNRFAYQPDQAAIVADEVQRQGIDAVLRVAIIAARRYGSPGVEQWRQAIIESGPPKERRGRKRKETA